MLSAKKDVAKLTDSPVNCYYSPLKNTSLKFYSHYTHLNGDVYSVGDFALRTNNLDVVKVLCIYKKDNKFLGVVRKYSFARDVRSEFLNLNFDEENEVVEDCTKEYTVDLEQLKHKCFLVLAQANDSPYLISKNHLDSKLYFSCRYSLTPYGLTSILEPCTISSASLSKKQQKKTISSENTPVKYDTQDLNIEKNVGKMKNGYQFDTPELRNLVKKNLNNSFGNSPNKETSILNYSIVSDEEMDNPLVIKLKKSDKQNPKVLLVRLAPEHCGNVYKTEANENVVKKINEDYSSGITKNAENITPRKSTRKVSRISYAEFDSPKKLCQSKTGVSSPIKRKATVRSSTPTKKDCVEINKSDNECSTTRKKIKSKFYYYVSESDSDQSGKIEETPKKRTIIQPKRYESAPLQTPKTNLNRSIRKSILRSRTESTFQNNCYNTRRKSIQLSNTPKYTFTESDSTPTKTNRQKVPRIRRVSVQKTLKKCQSSDLESDRDSDDSPPRPKSQKRTQNTPNNRAKLIRNGVITPSMQSRDKAVDGASTPLMKARTHLHVSYVPLALPCREQEYSDVYNFVESKLLDGCGGCMYISGVPGTGKTATITSLINNLQKHNEDVPKFDYVSVNGMKLTEPRQAYVEILKQLTGKSVPWEQAQSLLEERFTKSKKLPPCVMLVDELDILCTKRQDVVYNLLDWPTKAKNQLIVITIANTMDLPERLLMSRVTSRLGLTRLTFQAYTHKQLQEIVTKRLSGTDSFNPDAIQFVARKVASVSGDARRALDICRRAAEIAELEGDMTLVTMSHVNEALNAMITQPKVRAIKRCSRLEQLLLQSIVAEVERTGVEETTFMDIYKMLGTVSAIDGFKIPSSSISFAAVSRLSASRLILTDPKCNDMYQRIILNVSVDDVYYALKD